MSVVAKLVSDIAIFVLKRDVKLQLTNCCGQTAGWIKIPLGTKVGLPSQHCVAWGASLPAPKRHSPQFSAHVYCGQTVAHLSYC